jgi:hypothetical protein
MQVLMVWLGNLIASFVPYFTKRFAFRTAIISATLTGTVAFAVAMAVGIKALFLGITYALPTWAAPGAMFLPSNLPLCISAVITANLVRFAYDLNVKNFREAARMMAY